MREKITFSLHLPSGGILFSSRSASFSPSPILSSSRPFLHPPCNLSLWKLNEGMYCVGSAISGPTKLIGEKLFVPLLLQSTWEKKSQTGSKRGISCYNCPAASFHYCLLLHNKQWIHVLLHWQVEFILWIWSLKFALGEGTCDCLAHEWLWH